MSASTARLQGLGGDGLTTLALSCVLVVAAGGLSWLGCLAWAAGFARRAPSRPAKADAILVPGVRLPRCGLHPDFEARLRRAAALQRDGDLPVLLLGGVCGDRRESEAACGRDYLSARGVDPTRLLLEERSRNSLENLREARALARQRGWERPALVTNRYHAPRMALLGRGLGLGGEVCGAEERLRLTLPVLLKLAQESFYIHWYLTGKAWARLTRSRASLARIS